MSYLYSYVGGVDYTRRTVVLTFDPITSRSCTDIPIINDDVPEDDETFTVTVTDTGINITPDIGIVTIVDDDGGFFSVCAYVCTYMYMYCVMPTNAIQMCVLNTTHTSKNIYLHIKFSLCA